MYIIMNPNGANGSFTSDALLKRRVKWRKNFYYYFQLAVSSILCNDPSANLRCFDCCLNAELVLKVCCKWSYGPTCLACFLSPSKLKVFIHNRAIDFSNTYFTGISKCACAAVFTV